MRILSLKQTLLLGFILVIAATSLASTFVGIYLIHKSIVPFVQDKVRLDLNSARGILQEVVSHVENVIRLTGKRPFLIEATESRELDALVIFLKELGKQEQIDIITITDTDGKVIIRARNPKQKGYFLRSTESMKEVLSQKKAISSFEVLSKEELSGEGEDLADLALIKILPTEHSRQSSKTAETSGLCVIACAPIINKHGVISGILWGGKLINHDRSIIEKVRHTVSEDRQYQGRDICAVTIFLGDVRISTNVKKNNGESSIGTLISKEVYNKVLVSGKTWMGRAFEVHDWYLKAYEPIKNLSGITIGILGLGMLESKVKEMQRNALLNSIGITIGGISLAIIIYSFLARRIMKPIGLLVEATEKLTLGKLKSDLDTKQFPKEIVTLAQAFNSMADSIKERDEQLRRQAQEEIGRSERLAMIGRLSSGVAHEINNPLGSILLFSRLLLRKASLEGLQRENLERIEKETKRCQNIVQGLLDFARKREPKVETLNINDVLDKAIMLFEKHPMLLDIKILKEYRFDLPIIFADIGQMNQVFANIIMNAIDAMEGHGILTIRTSLSDSQKDIEISFSDTGHGIPSDDLEKVFEPFFTTKGVGHGTGLGLSVTHGIIEAHGGTIKVESRLGEGTTFIITLPILGKNT